MLIGFDFPFGYPSGVARHVTGFSRYITTRWDAPLASGPTLASLMDEIDELRRRLDEVEGRPRARRAGRASEHEPFVGDDDDA